MFLLFIIFISLCKLTVTCAGTLLLSPNTVFYFRPPVSLGPYHPANVNAQLSDHHYNAYNTKDSGHYSERNASTKSAGDCPVNIHTKCNGAMKGQEGREKVRSAFVVVNHTPPPRAVANFQHHPANWQHLAVQC